MSSSSTTTMMMHTILTTTPAITPPLPEEVLKEETLLLADGASLDDTVTVGVVNISPPGVVVVDITVATLAAAYIK